MSQFFPGRSVCQFCDQVINAEDETISFRAFLPEGHKYWRFADSTFHRLCFQNWPEHGEMVSLYDRWTQIYKQRPKGIKTEAEMIDWYREAYKDFLN